MKIPHDTQVVVTAVADDRLRIVIRRQGGGEVTWEATDKKPLPPIIEKAARALVAAASEGR